MRSSANSAISPPESFPRWLAHWPVMVAVCLLVALPLLFVARGEKSEWNDCYYTATSHLLRHEPMHHAGESYAYPPSMALVAVGLGAMPLKWSLAVWGAINALATVVTFACAWRLIGGTPLKTASRQSLLIFALGTVLAVRWIVSPLEHQQFDMVIAALVMLGCSAIVARCDVRGGLALGIAASMKCTPLLFAPYLAWRGRWLAALCVAIGAVGMNVLPDFLFPKTSGGWYVVDWYQVFIGDVSKTASGMWHSDLALNQSIGGWWNRYFRVGFPTAIENLQAIDLGPTALAWVKRLTHGTSLLLVGLTAIIGGRAFRDPAEETSSIDGRIAEENSRSTYAELWGIEFAAICCLMLMMSPMSSKAHYVVLWLPCLLLARNAIARPNVWRWTALSLLLVTGTLTTKGLIGKFIGDLTLMWGFPTFFALATLVTLWGEHRAVKARASSIATRDQHGSAAATRRAA